MSLFSELFNLPTKPYDPYEDLLESPGKEAFARLFEAEAYFVVPQAHYNDDAKMASRVAAVQIIETNYPNTIHAFDPLIPYMAITYFDRYSFANDDCPRVVGTSGNGSDSGLFAISCLTISWKLRDYTFKLAWFLRDKNLPYSTENVLEMELAICRALDWRMRTVTPFLFAGFFSPYLELPKAESEIHHLILATQREVGFGGLARRPSVIAAAALLAVAKGMVSDDHSIYLLLSVICESQPLIPLEDEIMECRNQMGLLYEPPVDDSPAPPRRRRSPQSSLPHGQTSSGTDQAPAGTGKKSPERRTGKEHVVDPDDDENIDSLKDIVDTHVVDSHVVDSDDDEDETTEDPIYDLRPRTRKAKAGEGTSTSQTTTTDQKKAVEVTSQTTTTDQKKAVEVISQTTTTSTDQTTPPQTIQPGSGGTRKLPSCCNIQ